LGKRLELGFESKIFVEVKIRMKSSRHPFLITGFFVFAFLLAGPSSSHAVLGLFEKDKKEAPPAEKIAQDEAEAKKLLQEAQQMATEKKVDRARDIYRKIVKSYPLTQSAAISQFAIGESLEAEGKPMDAFDAYQVFVEKYVHEAKFGDAIARQFKIATEAKDAKNSRILGVFKAKTERSKVVEMFRKIATSAPYSEYAPRALFNVGAVEREAGHDDKALIAFQEIMDNYPKDGLAKEASLKIIEIRQSKNTRDDSRIARTQIEMEKFLYDYSDDPRASGLREKVGELNDRDAQKKLEIGQYYEKKKNYRAAAIYYKSVPSKSQAYEKAQAALKHLGTIDPNLLQSPSAPKKRVVADTEVTKSPNYVGPPPPQLKTPGKPKMRVSDEELRPIPVE
jgi:outer membrane protein assembly factor BamD